MAYAHALANPHIANPKFDVEVGRYRDPAETLEEHQDGFDSAYAHLSRIISANACVWGNSYNMLGWFHIEMPLEEFSKLCRTCRVQALEFFGVDTNEKIPFEAIANQGDDNVDEESKAVMRLLVNLNVSPYRFALEWSEVQMLPRLATSWYSNESPESEPKICLVIRPDYSAELALALNALRVAQGAHDEQKILAAK